MLKRHTRQAAVPIGTRLTLSTSTVTAPSSLQGVAGLVTYALALCHGTQMGVLPPVTLRRNMESPLYGTKCHTPPAPALGTLGHDKNDSCLSVAAPPHISLPRCHPQLLISRGGAHILLTYRHPEGMHAISHIPHILAPHLAIVGALPPYQLY